MNVERPDVDNLAVSEHARRPLSLEGENAVTPEAVKAGGDEAALCVGGKPRPPERSGELRFDLIREREGLWGDWPGENIGRGDVW